MSLPRGLTRIEPVHRDFRDRLLRERFKLQTIVTGESLAVVEPLEVDLLWNAIRERITRPLRASVKSCTRPTDWRSMLRHFVPFLLITIGSFALPFI